MTREQQAQRGGMSKALTFRPDPNRKGAVIASNGHRYPSGFIPGSHWAIDEAWQILDTFTPGAIADDHRFLLGGFIAGALMRIAKTGAPR